MDAYGCNWITSIHIVSQKINNSQSCYHITGISHAYLKYYLRHISYILGISQRVSKSYLEMMIKRWRIQTPEVPRTAKLKNKVFFSTKRWFFTDFNCIVIVVCS